ncbi:MAG: hypothetical protein Q7S40_11940 [Opitutaceae bacterium]|nr:hypothetical protein [Opitutaceae bacterium]
MLQALRVAQRIEHKFAEFRQVGPPDEPDAARIAEPSGESM